MRTILIALGILCASPAFAFGWYGPGSGINFTGWVSAPGGFGFSWPWGFLPDERPYQRPNSPPAWNWVGPQSGYVGTPLQFAVSAYDPEGAQLTYTASNIPTGAAFNAATRMFSWTPTQNQTGNFTVSFRVSDGRASADMSVSITVNARYGGGGNPYYNTYGYQSYYQGYYGTQYPYQYQPPQISPIDLPPVLYPIPPYTVRVGERLSFQIQGYDREGNYLRYYAFNLPQGAQFDEGSHTFVWAPTRMQVGQYRVNFRVSQGGNAYAEAGTNITVLDASGQLPHPACSAGPGPYMYGFTPPSSVRAGDLYSYQVVASSGNANRPSYRVIDGPQGLTIDERTGYMRWVPAQNQRGTFQVRLGIYNGQCESVQTFNLTVY